MKLLISLTLVFSLSLSVDVWKSFVNEEGIELGMTGAELANSYPKPEYGGEGGDAFESDCQSKGGLEKIDLECGKYVGMLSLKCKNSPVFEAANGKALGNGDGDKQDFDASKITRIEISAGSYVDRATFYAGATAVSTCGKSSGGTKYTVDAPNGMVMCAVKGRSGWWMDKLAVGFCWPALTCPSGSTRFYGINADVGGTGLVGHIYDGSMADCQSKCAADKRCESFHFFSKYGHPGIDKTVCELYPIDAKPTGTYGNNSIVCRRCCANFYQHCDYEGWKRRECHDNTWIGESHNDHLSAVQVDAGCKVTLYQHIHYDGKKTAVTGNVKCLVGHSDDGISNWNDIVSSWKIGKGLSFRFSAMTEDEIMAEAQFVEDFDQESSFISNNPIIAFGAVALVGIGIGAYFYKQRQTSEYDQLVDDV